MTCKEVSFSKAACFDALIDDFTESVIGLSSSGIIVYANQPAEWLLKMKRRQLLGKSYFKLFAKAGFQEPISPDYFKHPVVQCVRTPLFDSSRHSLVLEWKIIPVFSKSNRLAQVFLMARRLESSESKEDTSRMLNQIINGSTGSLYWKDRAGRYLGCNLFMVQTLGFRSVNDIVGKTDFDLWPDQAKKIRKNDLSVIKSGETVFIEEDIKISSGDVLVFTGVKMPLRNDQGKIIGLMGHLLDMTKLKKTEEELRIAKEIAEAANQLKTEFIRNMHHDIRTPFSGIVGLTDFLMTKETDPEKRMTLSYILNSGKTLLNFCNNILDFSKVEMETFPVLSKIFNLLDLVNRVVAMEIPSAKTKHLTLSVHCDPNVPEFVIGDAYRLERILINLVSNAIKFTEEGFVKILVYLEKRKTKNRHFLVKFIIEDSGVGIPEDKRNVIYENFSKATPNSQGLFCGSGLGLRIVKQFVDEMDGDIHLKSKMNKGSLFTLLLPFKKPLAQEVSREKVSSQNSVNQ